MRLTRLVSLLFALVLLATALYCSPAPAASGAFVSPAAVMAWNQVAVNTIAAAGQVPSHRFVSLAYVQAAVYDAVVAIQGGYEPYKLDLPRKPKASIDAAVTVAAHDVLVYYFPGQQATLDAQRDAWLNGILAADAKKQGILLGQAAAAGIIELRQGDGLNAAIGFTMPAPAPGVWQLPQNVQPQIPWLSKLKPFMLKSQDQFRPGPPLALTSAQYTADFKEVKDYGAQTGSLRTGQQTEVALFWSPPSADQFNAAFTKLAGKRGFDAVQTARLYAMGNMVGADALVGCWEAKYHYLFWRPITAIPNAASDGNPDTEPVLGWTPLLATPPHPEYPSAHSCVTSAIAGVLAQVTGSNNIDVDIYSSVTQTTRHYNTAADLRNEIMDARVWAGLHYRTSGAAGIALGRDVANWTLGRYFKPQD